MSSEYVVAAMLVVLGIAHSALGETTILKPLFGQPWVVATPRWAVERILRFAWHLTSIAWFALAAIAIGIDVMPIIMVFAAVSAAVVFVALRGHLAWPLFLVAALAAGRADGVLGEKLLLSGALAASAGLTLAAVLHVYWAMGGRWLIDIAVPPARAGSRMSSPGPVLTLAVAGALAVLATLTVAVAFGRGPDQLRWLLWCAVAILTMRAIGDTKTAGFTKTDRSSAFARADDRWFTPIVVFLALGVSAAGLMS